MAILQFAGSVDAVSLGEVRAAELTTQKKFIDGKRSDEDSLIDGVPVYPLREVSIRQDGSPIQGASLKVKHPTDLKALTPYTLVNPSVVAWVRDGRSVAFSVTADRLEPVKGSN
jgi:hypothetical protein